MFERISFNKYDEPEKIEKDERLFTDLSNSNEELADNYVDRIGFSRMLIAYMNYDNDDPKYDGYRQRESKETYGNRVLHFLSRVAVNDKELTFPEAIKRNLLAYMNYDNENPEFDGYRQRESKETYGNRVLDSICEANKDIDFDDPNVVFNIAKDIILTSKSRGL